MPAPPLINEQSVSLVEKPVPVTSTMDPAGAEVGFSVIDAAPPKLVTVKVAVAESPFGVPVMVIV